jgi:predicted secreted protein
LIFVQDFVLGAPSVQAMELATTLLAPVITAGWNWIVRYLGLDAQDLHSIFPNVPEVSMAFVTN